MSRTLLHPEIVESDLSTGGWVVVIYDNDETNVDDVIAVLMKSTGCSATEAHIETWEAQTYGKAPVHFSEKTECEIVAAMISTVGVRTVVKPEWD